MTSPSDIVTPNVATEIRSLMRDVLTTTALTCTDCGRSSPAEHTTVLSVAMSCHKQGWRHIDIAGETGASCPDCLAAVVRP
jgi:hypothetical protein